VRFGRTVSSISLSRKATSYRPRPRLRNQTTMSMRPHHRPARRRCPGLASVIAQKTEALQRLTMRARRSKLSLIRSEADLPGDVPMKHPVRSDFDTAVTEAGVTVTFRPRKAWQRARTLHASAPCHRGLSDTRDRVAILQTTLPTKFRTWRSILLWRSARRFGQFKTRKRPTN
jgi:hypothetical protein